MTIPDLLAAPGRRVDLDRFPNVRSDKTDFVEYLVRSNSQFFAYDQAQHLLYVHSNIPSALLSKMKAESPNDEGRQLIRSLGFAVQTDRLNTDATPPEADQINFLKNSRYELAAQVQLGRFFYHHTYFFGPMLSYSLGVSPNKIPMLYGFGSTLSLAQALKWMGGVNLNNYFTFFYASYIGYMVLVLVASYFILKDRRYLSIICVGLLGYLVLPGYEDFLQAPGFNPLRHWPDFIIFATLYWFARSRSWVAGLAVAVVSCLAIWWSAEFGMLVMLSAIAGCVYAGLSVREFRIKIVFCRGPHAGNLRRHDRIPASLRSAKSNREVFLYRNFDANYQRALRGCHHERNYGRCLSH